MMCMINSLFTKHIQDNNYFKILLQNLTRAKSSITATLSLNDIFLKNYRQMHYNKKQHGDSENSCEIWMVNEWGFSKTVIKYGTDDFYVSEFHTQKFIKCEKLSKKKAYLFQLILLLINFWNFLLPFYNFEHSFIHIGDSIKENKSNTKNET